DPASRCIEVTEKQHEKRSKLPLLIARSRRSGTSFVEDCCGLPFAARVRIAVRKAVVRHTSTGCVKNLVTLLQGIQKSGERINVRVAGLTQPLYPAVKCFRLVYLKGSVRTKCWINAKA